jgi:peptidoglycan/xylan/chitin deacetylase (PgdA/CDA1 family)
MGGDAGHIGNHVVPILLYHAVTEDPGSHIAPFTVSPAEFERHMDVVLAAGRTSVTFGELVGEGIGGPAEAARSGGGDRRVVVTFDDGYADFAETALPALQARGIASTLFVTTGWLAGGPNREPGPSDPMLSWSQLPELQQAGIDLGAHSHSHPHMDTLARLALRAELDRSKHLLEDALGREIDTFAYPHGYNGARVRQATRDSGYRAAAAVRNALHRPGGDPYAVARLMVTRETTASEVAGWLDGLGAPVAGTRESLATRGWRAYRRGRALMRRAPGSAYR